MNWKVTRLLIWLSLCESLFSVTTEEIYKGVLSLDELTFDKVVSRFRYALVKFDHPYPYGVDHENFVRLGKQLAKLKRTDAIAVNLEVKDYGEMDSLLLAKRYGITKEQFPALRLFINPKNCKVAEFSKLKPLVYEEERSEKENKIILDPVSMRLFLWRKTGIRATLPNCTEDLDQLAEQFLGSLPVDQQDKAKKIIKQVEAMSKKSSLEKRKSAQIYLKFMQKGLERGSLFYESEQKRIINLLVDVKEKVTVAKRKELQAHFNVLQSFRVDQYAKEVPDPQLSEQSQPSTSTPPVENKEEL